MRSKWDDGVYGKVQVRGVSKGAEKGNPNPNPRLCRIAMRLMGQWLQRITLLSQHNNRSAKYGHWVLYGLGMKSTFHFKPI